MRNLPKIQCAVCGKPVDRVVVERNDANMSTEVHAFCHDDKDIMVVRDHQFRNLQEAKELEVAVARGGVAFQPKRISNDQ